MLSFYWRKFSELSLAELYDVLALREGVFVIEQRCFYHDIDFQDQKAIHLLGYQDQKLVAYLRLFPKGTLYPEAISFGRVVTAKSFRGQNYAKKAMEEVFSYLKKTHQTGSITISAQVYLQKFYESFGFNAIGDSYDEDGIPHIKMTKSFDNSF